MPRTISMLSTAGLLAAVIAASGTAVGAEDGGAGPLAGLRTEEVQAGVHRVLGDEYRDLPTGAGWRVEAGLDGSVWLLSPDEALPLGDERAISWPDDEGQADLTWWSPNREGELQGWASNANEEWFVASLAGPDSEPQVVPLDDGLEPYALMPNGRAWAHQVEDYYGRTYALWQLTGDGWTMAAEGLDIPGPQVTADGELWLGAGFFPFETPELRRFDGEAWVTVAAPERSPYAGWTVGPEGTVWTWANYRIEFPDSAFLARLEDGVWASWERDEVPPFADMQPRVDTAVAPDGALWVAAPVWVRSVGDLVKRCRGVTRFDGAAPTTYLADHCVQSLSIGPDGSVWLRANEVGAKGVRSQREPFHTYVIMPSASTDAG